MTAARSYRIWSSSRMKRHRLSASARSTRGSKAAASVRWAFQCERRAGGDGGARETPPRRPRKARRGADVQGSWRIPQMIPRARIAKPAGFEDPIRSKTAVLEETSAGHRSLPVSETGRVRGVRDAGRRRRKWIFCRNFSDGAAQESNLPTVGLPRPAGFEDQAGLAQRSGVSGVCAPKRAPDVRCFALTSLGLVSASLGAGTARVAGEMFQRSCGCPRAPPVPAARGWLPE